MRASESPLNETRESLSVVGGREEVPVQCLVSVSRARRGSRRSSGACQKNQIGSFPSGFKVVRMVVPDQDRISYVKLMWHHGRSWFVCFFSNSQESFLISYRAFK